MTEQNEHRDTKDRILDAAEELFADQGFAATSLREITALAGANLAAVNYHFGSKDELIRAVFARRLEPLGAIRLAMLDQVLADAGDGPPRFEAILEAFVGPLTRPLPDSAPERVKHFIRLFPRLYTERSEHLTSLFKEHMAETAMRFHEALSRAAPEGVSPDEMMRRLLFAAGVMVHVLTMSTYLQAAMPMPLDTSDSSAMTDSMIAFLAAGMRAPAPTVGPHAPYPASFPLPQPPRTSP